MESKDKATEINTKIKEDYPLVPHTGAGRLFSLVRRMTQERKFNIPIHMRTGFGISVKTGKAANDMKEEEWEIFYNSLLNQLRRDYPGLYSQIETG